MSSMRSPAAAEVIDALSLAPDPVGGWSRVLPEVPTTEGQAVPRVVTRLLTADAPASGRRRHSTDSLQCFHRGGPVAVVSMAPDGAESRHVLGPDLAAGQLLKVLVPAGWSSEFELLAGSWALTSEATAAVARREPAAVGGGRGARARDGDPRSPARSVGGQLAGPSDPVPDLDYRAQLDLEANLEGGFYRQTYESVEELTTSAGRRPMMNSIYYLLTPESPLGALHRNRSHIAHFHHAGSPATYRLVSPDGDVAEVVLGRDYLAGQIPTFTASGGDWKTSRIDRSSGVGCLISEAVVPGFRYDDHEMATLDGFAGEHPVLLDSFRDCIADAGS